MITVVNQEEGVSVEMCDRTKTLIQDNIFLMYENDYPQSLQSLMNSEYGGLWSVLTLRGADEYEALLSSKDQTGMIFAFNDILIMLAQAHTPKLVAPCSQEQLDERVQLVHQACVERSLNLQETCLELQGAIEAGAGAGVTALVFIENALTQFEMKGAYGELESECVCSIGEDRNLRVVVLVTPISDSVFEEYADEIKHENIDQSDNGYSAMNNSAHAQSTYVRKEIEDDYEEPMKMVFRVFESEQQFKQSGDQIKISFDSLEVNSLKLSSFTFIFQMAISPQPKEIKDDLNIFSTGSSLMSKNIVMGINKDNLFFLTFLTQQGKLETMYSQMKLKRNQVYQIAVVFQNTTSYKELTLYINGSVENQVSLTQGIDIPRGFFWVGSEQALKLFRGMVRDVVFIAMALQNKHLRRVHSEIVSGSSQGQNKPTAAIVELILQEQYIEGDEQQQQNADKSQIGKSMVQVNPLLQKKHRSKQNFIPLHLQRTHFVNSYGNDQDIQVHSKHTQEEEETPKEKTVLELADVLNQHLTENLFLFNKVRETSLNFYWVFTTCSLLAPSFEESEQPKLPFQYLHHNIFKEKFDQYPVYAIEIDRFIKVFHYAGINLSKEEIMEIANISETLKYSKDSGYYVIFDRFLLTCRQATLSIEEIEMIKASYSNEDKEQDQDLILQQSGIHRQQVEPEANFSFFSQLVKLVGGDLEAFKYRMLYIVAYYVQPTQTGTIPNVQRLSVIYHLPENNQEVEVEGVEFFQVEDDKIFSQRVLISETSNLKYFRVHYSPPNNQMSMVSFKTETQEETFLFDRSFTYVEGKDASGLLQTYPIENVGRLAGFRGSLQDNMLVSLQAEYLVKDPEVQKQKNLQPEILPEVAETWFQGKFQVIVNRHQDSTAHTTTHWPSEYEFANRFNDLGAILKDMFPNIELICNWDHRYSIEHFDVYIRGVGPVERRDRQGRVFLFTKKEKVAQFMENFTKRMLKVYDEIVLIAQAYGDTIELEKTQDLFFKTNAHLFPPRTKDAQDYPCQIPEKAEKVEATDKKRRR